jgi:Helix-turn-helix of DDE superfamily endonuclease
MDVYREYLKKSPQTFKRLVGVNMGTFCIILAKYEVELEKYKGEKMFRRQGRKSNFSIANQLLLCFLYLRNYDTFINLGLKFGISESYAHKRFKFSKMILLRCLNVPDALSLKDALQTNLIAIDVSEQAIERPVKQQQDYYSGKKNSTP